MEALPLLLVLAVALTTVVVWVWALVDAMRAPAATLRNGSKALWLAVIVLGQFVGAMVYLWVGRPER